MSAAHYPQVPSSYLIGPHRYGLFLSPSKVIYKSEKENMPNPKPENSRK